MGTDNQNFQRQPTPAINSQYPRQLSHEYNRQPKTTNDSQHRQSTIQLECDKPTTPLLAIYQTTSDHRQRRSTNYFSTFSNIVTDFAFLESTVVLLEGRGWGGGGGGVSNQLPKCSEAAPLNPAWRTYSHFSAHRLVTKNLYCRWLPSLQCSVPYNLLLLFALLCIIFTGVSLFRAIIGNQYCKLFILLTEYYMYQQVLRGILQKSFGAS